MEREAGQELPVGAEIEIGDGEPMADAGDALIEGPQRR